jgi:4-aminobutyrate aminotransferase/(S)-3-amino-2-methylpropionate transaminase
VAAVIIEPILGEGGFVPAPAEYLQGLRSICDRHGIVLIFDEVQSGFARTGKWAAYQHAGVTPDISTWAKSMGGGMPISAVLGKAEILDAAQPGTVGGTYGGNPVACAAALAAIHAIESRGLCERAAEIGDQVRARFNSLKERSPLVGDVRGLGAMVALELCHERDPGRPAAEETAAALAACREDRVLVLPAGPHGNIIRILAPLVISDVDLTRGLLAIDAAVMAVSGAGVAA